MPENRPHNLLPGRRLAAFGALAAIPLALAVRSGAHPADHTAKPGTDAARVKARKLTYARDVAGIIEKNCAVCHHAGEVAPFPLVTYQDVKKRAKQIAIVTSSRFMPPWKADSHGEFLDERRLTDEQIATIQAWADEGAPLGDAKDLPPTPTFKSGWKLGPPDQVVGLTEPYKLSAEGRDVYRCFVIPTDGKEDRYLSAIEVHPGNRNIVHHLIAYVDTSGQARKMDAADPGPGYTSSGGGPGFLPAGFLGGWAPGNETRRLPDGVGNLLPKGADIVLEVHYHKSGKPETDQTQVGLYFAKGPVQKRIHQLLVLNPFFRIPPGEKHYEVTASMPVFKDITVLGITPHMHLLGRDMKVTAKLPDGTVKPLVSVPDWDFNWQLTYAYRQPVKLPKGTVVNLVAHYDNSDDNPRNPNHPLRAVGWGEQTTDEMCIAFLGYTVDGAAK